jgi:hypothetical protein
MCDVKIIPLDCIAGCLRYNNIDCSDLINGNTIHIFEYHTTEEAIRKLLGDQLVEYKLGIYGNINSKHNKGVYHEIKVK